MLSDGLEYRYKLGIKLDLERIKACLKYLGNPEKNFKSVLISGTNGKGSVTYYLSNLACKLTGYKTGRYTSPHLRSWNERFVINEKIATDETLSTVRDEVLEGINKFEKEFPALDGLTVFEIYTIIAFKLFAKENIELAFLEVGMGGRLDATNVIKTENLLCSVITNISLDHTKMLGETIEKIAYEKSGIIKENNFTVTGAKGAALNVIEKQAKEKKSKLITLQTQDHASYIQKNIELSLLAWEIISKQIKTNIYNNNLNKKDFLSSLVFPGRFQLVNEGKGKGKGKILLDGAHNPEAASELKKLIASTFKNKTVVYIIGILDKDYTSFIKNLILDHDLGQAISTVICTEPKSERATKKEILAQTAAKLGAKALVSKDLNEALLTAKNLNPDIIVITGSLYLVGEALELAQEEERVFSNTVK